MINFLFCTIILIFFMRLYNIYKLVNQVYKSKKNNISLYIRLYPKYNDMLFFLMFLNYENVQFLDLLDLKKIQ